VTNKVPKTSLSLDSVCLAAKDLLSESEYLIERHSINIGEDYTSIQINAKWLAEYQSIALEVIFDVSKDQQNGMKQYLDDDEVKDDIDSAIGEIFEELLAKTYPSYDWRFPIGKVSIKIRKIK
jgi:hypothetical protein